MPGKAKKILTAAGVAAATTGLVVAAKRRSAGRATVFHVKPVGDRWAIVAEGQLRARGQHDTKKDAVAAGRELARKEAPSRLVIHGADGRVQRSHEYEPEG